jgi:hypothetical protein
MATLILTVAYVFHQDVFSVGSESVVSWSRYLTFYSTAILFAIAELDTYINHSFLIGAEQLAGARALSI